MISLLKRRWSLVTTDEQFQDVMSSTENVVRLRVLNDNFKTMMAASSQELHRAGLKIDCFGFRENAQNTDNTAPPCTPHVPLSCSITVLYDYMHVAIKKPEFSVYRGHVYKKVADSQYTFQFFCTMKTFLLNVMGNDSFKDRLVQHFHCVLPLLNEPESSLIDQLKIDPDLVEVQEGWFWSFSGGSFKQGTIPESHARTFCVLFLNFSIVILFRQVVFSKSCQINIANGKLLILFHHGQSLFTF